VGRLAGLPRLHERPGHGRKRRRRREQRRGGRLGGRDSTRARPPGRGRGG
jgi:hypothetical protein